MTQLSFGPGAAWGERIDTTGSGIGPVQFGIMQNLTFDTTFTTKQLYGQNQFPVAVARGEGKVTVKIVHAQIIAEAWADLFYGDAVTTGQLAVAQFEAATVPASSPYTVTVANASNYNDDLGVLYATGGRFTRVTTPTASGQYSVNLATGVYTFSSADSGAAVVISYTWNNATSGNKITITNQPSGTTPFWKMTFYQKVSPSSPGQAVTNKPLSLRLNACTSSKFALGAKLDDFMLPEIDLDAYADSSGIVGYISTVE